MLWSCQLRLTDLSPTLMRQPERGRRFYVPPPVPSPRPRRRTHLVLALAIAGLACGATAGRIGDQSAFAAISGEAPSWVTTLRAPDPGVALSPHVADGTIAAAVGDPLPTVAARKDDSRLPTDERLHRALASPLDGVLGTATSDDLPRVTFVAARRQAVVRDQKEAARATAEAALTSTLSAYAPAPAAIDDTPFDLLLGDAPAATRPHGISGGGRDHWWSDRPLPDDIESEASLRCLTEAVYFEARSESELGQRAVAQVVINRVKNPAYPDDVCGVVYQNKDWRDGCQFTFACDRTKDVATDAEAWATAERIAREYASGTAWIDDIGAATHYHANHVTPSWASLMNRTREIGHHVFYITKGGGWT